MAVRLGRSAEASIEIDAPIDEVWALVSDVTRVGEYSVECRSCEWMGDDAAPRTGARFRGRNRRNTSRWTRICEVVDVDAPNRFVWRTLPTRVLPDSTEWRFELAETGGRTQLTESFQVLKIPALYDRMFALMLPQHRDRTPDLQADLQRIKQRIEAASVAATKD